MTNTTTTTQATETDTTGEHFAAIGDDGTRPVVWGLGHTADEAREEAEVQFRENGCRSAIEIRPITAEQYAVVDAGDVSWPVGGAS